MGITKEKEVAPGDNQEHDTFVKKFFCQPRWAMELFRLILPQELFEILDFSRLRAHISEAAFEEDGELRSDILFSVPPFGEDWVVYLYFEHSSGDSKATLIREIRHKAEAIEALMLETDPGCQVISTLLYQPRGSDKSWYYRRRPREKNKANSHIHDILERFGLSDGIYVLDLGLVKPEELKTYLTMRAALYTLKYVRETDFKDKVPMIAGWLQKDAALYDIELLSKYIMKYCDVSITEFDTLIESFEETKLGVETMGIGQLIREDAYRKGFEKGLGEKLQIADNLLRKGVLLDVVLESMGLTEAHLRESGVLEG